LYIENGIVQDIIRQGSPLPDVESVIDVSGRFVLPGWCDSHTHIVFAQSREQEFVDRIHGLSYEEIALRGGGILNSARKLADTSEEELFSSALHRLNEVIAQGTCAVEIKSGYGLSVESELKMLRVIRRLSESQNIPIKATFLGAHAYPMEYRNAHDGYIDLIINKMLPAIAKDGLADFVDAFCEENFFSVEETERIVTAAKSLGLVPKLHVNQLTNNGGVQMGIRCGALSVDHLEQIGTDEIALLAKSQTIATVLPSCSFFLNIPYAPARELVDAGAAVAIASDYNPGSTPSGRMPFLLSLACIKMRLTPEEAINAVTINGAHAMACQQDSGVIWPGREARVLITRPMRSLAYIPYAFGSDHIEKVVLGTELREY
jgi:imidazolonepropionase